MSHKSKLLLILIACTGYSCSESQTSSENKMEDIPVVTQSPEVSAIPPEHWIAERVSNVKKRLTGTKEGELLLKAMEAHGGLYNWYANGPLSFRFDYNNLKSGGPDTYQIVDTWSARARHQLVSDTTLNYGWDGEKAWKYPYDAEVKDNPRFWSLTPYFFVGVPFVLADKGINFKYQDLIEFENNQYHQILVTFDSGMGDAPDDFYVIYIDTEKFTIGGLRYIVSYPGYYAKGEHGPEKHMSYYGARTIDGILIPRSIKTYRWDGKASQEQTVDITISNVSFRPDIHPRYFNVPEGSRVMTGYKFDE